ncbi:MAG: hypothetical protein F4Y24_15825 [Gemmatimonadetes bacterium]|nr:hypothetical protein [Gemmatimonadota bacterium]MYG23197.1 hypothetical protein [Gemmatimonadota bacterium]MYJ39810.1 hypothetical protein [Gemmatimonadota bacterium]
MTSETETKPFDCVKSMREIRNRISTEIADMSYAELSRWLDRRVREDPFFARIPSARRSARPSGERTGARATGSSSATIGDGTRG